MFCYAELGALAPANAFFVTSLGFYLWADKRIADDRNRGTTYPKDEPYEDGGQTYPWEAE